MSSYSSSSESQNIAYPPFCFSDMDIFPWTPGSSDLELPADVGFAFGNASGGITSVSINTHYDNPEGIEGMVDSSGVRVYYTEEPRAFDMGVSTPFSCVVSRRLQYCSLQTFLFSIKPSCGFDINK